MRHQFKSMPTRRRRRWRNTDRTGAKTSFEFIPEKEGQASITSLGKNEYSVNFRNSKLEKGEEKDPATEVHSRQLKVNSQKKRAKTQHKERRVRSTEVSKKREVDSRKLKSKGA